jgi:hypothetical protein
MSDIESLFTRIMRTVHLLRLYDTLPPCSDFQNDVTVQFSDLKFAANECAVFGDMTTPCNSSKNQRFEGTYLLHLQCESSVLKIIIRLRHIPEYTILLCYL